MMLRSRSHHRYLTALRRIMNYFNKYKDLRLWMKREIFLSSAYARYIYGTNISANTAACFIIPTSHWVEFSLRKKTDWCIRNNRPTHLKWWKHCHRIYTGEVSFLCECWRDSVRKPESWSLVHIRYTCEAFLQNETSYGVTTGILNKIHFSKYQNFPII